MGRRKVYLTTEAKREANCAKSRRSYERNRAATNERRRKTYQPKERPTTPIAIVLGTPREVLPAVPGLAYSVQRILQIHKNLAKLTNHQPARDYVDSIRIDYMNAPSNTNVQEAVASVLHYRAMTLRHQDTLLQIVGPTSQEWMDADTVYQEISLLVRGLEDLEAYTMLGREEVEAQYKARALMYQTW